MCGLCVCVREFDFFFCCTFCFCCFQHESPSSPVWCVFSFSIRFFFFCASSFFLHANFFFVIHMVFFLFALLTDFLVDVAAEGAKTLNNEGLKISNFYFVLFMHMFVCFFLIDSLLFMLDVNQHGNWEIKCALRLLRHCCIIFTGYTTALCLFFFFLALSLSLMFLQPGHYEDVRLMDVHDGAQFCGFFLFFCLVHDFLVFLSFFEQYS